jgi:hypothetical protein
VRGSPDPAHGPTEGLQGAKERSGFGETCSRRLRRGQETCAERGGGCLTLSQAATRLQGLCGGQLISHAICVCSQQFPHPTDGGPGISTRAAHR